MAERNLTPGAGNVNAEMLATSPSDNSNFVLLAAGAIGMAVGGGCVGWFLARASNAKEVAVLETKLATAEEACARAEEKVVEATKEQSLVQVPAVQDAISSAMGMKDGFALPITPRTLPSGWAQAKREKAGTACNVMLAATLP